jgi:hypothetical protein
VKCRTGDFLVPNFIVIWLLVSAFHPRSIGGLLGFFGNAALK